MQRKRATKASHLEIYECIKRGNIVLASDLLNLAEEQSAAGDHRLLHYCVGSRGGAKKNLQASIDAVWRKTDNSSASNGLADSPVTGCATSAEENRRPLEAARLCMLQEAALQPCDTISAASRKQQEQAAVKCAGGHALSCTESCKLFYCETCRKSVKQSRRRFRCNECDYNVCEPCYKKAVDKAFPTLRVQRKVSDNKRMMQSNVKEGTIRNSRNRKLSVVQHMVLFDGYKHRAEIVFRPRDCLWRLRDFYELLVACRQEEVLAGASPSSAPGGGLCIPRSETGWQGLLRAGVAASKLHFSDLSKAALAEASAELRFGLACGALPWRSPSDDSDSWVHSMPADAAFEKDSLQSVACAEERLVRVYAHHHVEDRQLEAFVRCLEACGHTVEQTVGFKRQDGRLHISGDSVFTAKRHKGASTFGMLACPSVVKLKTQGVLCIGGSDQLVKQNPEAALKDSPGGKRLASVMSKSKLALTDAPSSFKRLRPLSALPSPTSSKPN
mmetsp:Transcript_152458/g.270487  ORF Transcript_152458/g.270487 Transcript_152458/m.270487 type:complete len:501 (-) Transcript_152458:71-1573(-)